MSLMLDEDECATLKQALDYYLPQLRMERAAAEARDAQHALAMLEEKLERLRARLDEAAVPMGAGVP